MPLPSELPARTKRSAQSRATPGQPLQRPYVASLQLRHLRSQFLRQLRSARGDTQVIVTGRQPASSTRSMDKDRPARQ